MNVLGRLLPDFGQILGPASAPVNSVTEDAMIRLLATGAVLALAGCNTVEGLGRDLQTVGGVMTGTATGVQNAATPAPGSSVAPPASCRPDADGLVLDGCPDPG
jgi:predicted small secreted protein